MDVAVRIRGLWSGLLVGVVVAATAGVLSASARAGGSGTAGADPRPVIVVLADQHEQVPATAAGVGRRRALAVADQQPLVDLVRAAGASNVRQFSVVNAFAATVPAAQVQRLAADPRVRAVVPDRVHTVARRPVAGTATAGGGAAVPICPADPAKPLLQPEALGLIDAVRAQRLTTGKGVKVGFIADGLDVTSPDLIRPDGTRVVADFQDFTGEGVNTPSSGTEAFGDASAIAAQGRQTYDLSAFVNPAAPLPPGCTIRILGVAPGVSLSAAKVLNQAGVFTDSMVVQGIDYEVGVAKVDVLNESLGNNPSPDLHTDPISLANHAAIAAGVTVVAASGDGGPFGTVGNPAGDPALISVAATTSFQTRAQLDRNLPGFTGTWTSGNVSSLSSGGVAELGTVDDLEAPGDAGWALCSPDPVRFPQCTDGRNQPASIQNFSGTSQSAPFVAATAALVISAYAATHGGARPDPGLVKQILTSTATDQGDPADRQGAGLLDAFRAVQAALSIVDSHGNPAPRDANLLVDPGQLSVTANPSTTKNLALSVTNIGAVTQTVAAHGRVLSRTVFDRRGSFPFDSTAPGVPVWVDGFGTAHAFTTRQFSVAPGADHLDASIAYRPPGAGQVRLRLLDPAGDLVAVDSNEGPAGFGHVDVHFPVPGTWTAIFDVVAGSPGFTGTVHFDFAGTAYAPFGSVTPASLTLQPGQRGTFHVIVASPAQPGDRSAAVALDTSTGRRLAVPLTLRSLIPITGGRGAYTGTLFGGNGRAGVPAQTSFYRFDVPPGLHDFGINLTLSRNPDQTVFGFLEAPDGQLLSQQTNITGFDPANNPIFGRSLQEFRTAPPPGRWTFVVVVVNPIAGTTTSQSFSGQVRFNTVDVHAAGVPDGVVLPAGQPVTATVSVHNNGTAPESFFVDPRRTGLVDQRLVTPQPETGVPLPQANPIGYTLPTQCDRITTTATAPVPIDVEEFSVTVFPYALSRTAGTRAVATVTAAEVTPGPWSTAATLIGPFPPGGATSTADLRTVGHCAAFDSTVTSTTGDIWPSFVQGTPPPFTPLVLQPGQTGTITVTFTPTGPAGTTVTGHLFIDDFSQDAGTGDELTALGYTYTTG